MVNSRRRPTFIPTMPSSQPLITESLPSPKVNGSPKVQDASNSSPLSYPTPT